MGLTRLQLIPKVRDRLQSTTDDALLTMSVLYSAINDGIQAFADERDWPWLEATTTIAVVAGTSSYALPADLVRFNVVDIDGNDLKEIQYREFLSYTNRQAQRPNYFAVVGDTIHLSPVPDVDYTLNLYYSRCELELADDSDETYAPARRASVLATYAALYASIQVRDAVLTASLMKLRDEELKRAIDDVQRGAVGPRIQTRQDNRA